MRHHTFSRSIRGLTYLAVVSIALPLVPALAHDGRSEGGDPSEMVRVIVRTIDGVDPGAKALEVENDHGHGRGRRGHVYRDAANGYSAEVPAATVELLKADPQVLSVEIDQPVYALATQSPSPSWGLDRIDQRPLPLDNSFTTATAGANVTAYIVDTGINTSHQDFAGRLGTGFTAIGGTPEDCNGHGTHVAGTVGGTTFGVAKAVTLVPVRVLDCAGSGSVSGVIAGIDWVVATHVSGPAVLNMSLGSGPSTAFDNAVARATADGITVVVAAGNSNVDACGQSPARAPSAITVGATTNTDARASYSNFGSCLDLFAPGSSITSSWIGSASATNTISGTSMASPHVAGAAAAYLGANPAATATQVDNAVTAAATTGRVSSAGTGSLNALLFIGDPATPQPSAPATVPGAPATATLAIPTTSRTVDVSWTPPSSDGGSIITGYRIRLYRSSGNQLDRTITVTSDVATTRFSSLSSGRRYYAVVNAINAVGNGATRTTNSGTTR